MTHGPEHHIEHAEHATHASHDSFDRRVTISIALVAAVLACVTMLGHKAHNETLRLQGEALQAQTEGGIDHSMAANKWGLFQAQNIRKHMYQTFGELAVPAPELAKARDRWSEQVKKYEEELPKWKRQAEDLTDKGESKQKKAGQLLQQSEMAHHRAERFDLGELGLQLGVVLCSLAILTKGKPFWYLGLAASLAGLGVAMSAYLPGHH
jgi:hypothetical protein